MLSPGGSGVRGGGEPGPAGSPFTNVYGVARTLLALNTLLVLLLHGTDTLFRPLGQELAELGDAAFLRFTLFSLLRGDDLVWARAVAVAILLVVMWGWRPRVTGILHWWVSWSFATHSFVVEGGDQITTILTLLLVPITLFDPRRSHWDAPPAAGAAGFGAWTATTAWQVIRLQVAFLYLHAAVGKLPTTEWANGTAIYYWFTHPQFGAPEWLQAVLMPVLTHPVGVLALTWGVLVLELSLFLALAMPRSRWPRMLLLGLGFHLAIVVIHGLVSFFLAMAAALVLYLRPLDAAFVLPRPRFPRRAAHLDSPVPRGVREAPAPSREGEVAGAATA